MKVPVRPPVGLSRDANHNYTSNYEGVVRVVPGVTGVMRVLDKPAIVPWAQGMVAEAAIAHRSELDGWVAVGGVDGAVQLLRRAAETQRDRAAGVGSEVHRLADAINRGTPVTVPDDLAPFVTAYQRWLTDFQPEFLASEEMVFSERGYGGTLDGVAVIAGETWLLDIKTSKGTYSDTALQLAAYANADFFGRSGDPRQYEIPRIDQYGVVHVRPEGAELVPYDVTDEDFSAFLAALHMHGWKTTKAKNVIGQAIGPALLNFGRKTA